MDSSTLIDLKYILIDIVPVRMGLELQGLYWDQVESTSLSPTKKNNAVYSWSKNIYFCNRLSASSNNWCFILFNL